MSVLSIQSHVVYGYAGNTAAVFPLQRLGNEVWAINTVEFSNHTGYGSWKGQALGADLVNDLVIGLEERSVLSRCSAVLSGYLGSAEVSAAILEAVRKVKLFNPYAIYCCDPVMGDVGRGVYVKPDIPEIIKKNLIINADIICPNQFELELLTGVKVDSTETALKAINIMHDMGPSIVLVTSFKDSEDEKNNTISLLVSTKPKSSTFAALETAIFRVTHPCLPIGDNVAGTGDLTTSVFLSRFLETKNPEKALVLCASSIYGILEQSYKLCYNEKENASGSSAPGTVGIELKIIDAQKELCSPTYTYKAVKIEK